MQEVMQSHFSVFRRGDTLQEGLDKLIALRDPLEHVTVDDRFAAVECRRWFRRSNSPISPTRRW